MKLEPGMLVVILAVLIFYLRLIILQRERAKRAQQSLAQLEKKTKKKSSKKAQPGVSYSVVSPRWTDRAIAGGGVLVMVVGVLLYAGVFGTPAWQGYWWVPTALGIVAFSWAFKLAPQGK